jgi:hypothetical protein
MPTIQHSLLFPTVPRLNELIALALAGDVLCCRLLSALLCPCYCPSQETSLRAFLHPRSFAPWQSQRTVHTATFIGYLHWLRDSPTSILMWQPSCFGVGSVFCIADWQWSSRKTTPTQPTFLFSGKWKDASEITLLSVPPFMCGHLSACPSSPFNFS